MDADERDICIYLKSWPRQFVAGREIARRAGGKRRFRENPNWAVVTLERLVEKGIVESDSTGHFRLRLKERKEKPRMWLSPQIKKILEDSNKPLDKVFELEEPEDFYDL